MTKLHWRVTARRALLFLGVLGLTAFCSVPVLAQSCDATAPCSSCAGQTDWECACPSNMPSGATVTACCCNAPGCTSGCTGCCTQWIMNHPVGPPTYGGSCMARSCQGGVNCQTFNCFGKQAATPVASLTLAPPGVPVDRPVEAPAHLSDKNGPILIENLSARSARENTIDSLDFDVRNVTESTLVFVVLGLHFIGVDGETVDLSFSEDLFLGKAGIRPQETRTHHLSSGVRLRAPISKVDVSLEFAETDGGHVFGNAPEGALTALHKGWREDLDLYAQVREILRRTGPGRETAVRQLLQEYAEKAKCSKPVAILDRILNKGDLFKVQEIVESAPVMP